MQQVFCTSPTFSSHPPKKNQTHISSGRVEHVSDSFAHLKQQLTCSLCLVRVLLQVWEHMSEQGIEIWNLREENDLFITDDNRIQEHSWNHYKITYRIIWNQTFLNVSDSKKRQLNFMFEVTHFSHQKGEALCGKLADMFLLVWQQCAVQTVRWKEELTSFHCFSQFWYFIGAADNNHHKVQWQTCSPVNQYSQTPADSSPVDVGHVLHHDPPQVLVEVGEAGERPLQDLCVLGVQQGSDENEEVGEVRIEVSLQVPGQLNHQAGGRSTGRSWVTAG